MRERYAAHVAAGQIVQDVAQEAVLPLFDELHAAIRAPARKRGFFGRARPAAPLPSGIYLWGSVGRGKSMLMDMFVEVADVPIRRVHFHAFMQEIHAGLHAARQMHEADALGHVAKDATRGVRVLALDEMQIGDITDAMIVGRLFDMLFSAGIAVVTTSNRSPDDLYKDGLNRALFLPFIALLKERMIIRELASDKDHRQGRLMGQEVYYSPADSAARQAIDTLWQKLSGGQEEEMVLRVKGRDMHLPRFHNGAARMTFWDLCGKALGAADYLELVRHVRVLVLEDVPRLGRANYNEARRFVTLVDTLYEARVKLIMSAADVPERLYVEGTGSFEFERTASRLREMQSADWGA